MPKLYTISLCRLFIKLCLAGSIFVTWVAYANSPSNTEMKHDCDRAFTPQGLSIVSSQFDVPTTQARLKQAITSRNLNIIAIVNHADNAASVGLSLRPTSLIIFGNPNLGTLLMQAEQTVGIDLPQKFLVWEEKGKTFIAYNQPQALSIRHNLQGVDDTLMKISGALKGIAEEAAKNELPK